MLERCRLGDPERDWCFDGYLSASRAPVRRSLLMDRRCCQTTAGSLRASNGCPASAPHDAESMRQHARESRFVGIQSLAPISNSALARVGS